MGLNFRKSLSIGKLFRINFSKSGIGVSAGVKGARISVGKNGVRETVSLPGTGLSWSEQQSYKKIKKAVTGKEPEKTPAMPKKKSKWLQWIWIAVIAGGFMLYQSRALDPMMTGIKNAFSGKGEAVAASAAPAASSAVESSVAPAASSSSADSSEGSNATALTGVATESLIVQLKDGQVTLAADTQYVASKSGEKFHKTDCSVVKSITTANFVEYSSREAATDDKKDPCSICKP